MRLFRHPWWQHLDYRVKVATTQENKPPTQGTRQWTFTTPRWRCGSILLPSLNAGVPEPTGGFTYWNSAVFSRCYSCDTRCDSTRWGCNLVHSIICHRWWTCRHWGFHWWITNCSGRCFAMPMPYSFCIFVHQMCLQHKAKHHQHFCGQWHCEYH